MRRTAASTAPRRSTAGPRTLRARHAARRTISPSSFSSRRSARSRGPHRQPPRRRLRGRRRARRRDRHAALRPRARRRAAVEVLSPGPRRSSTASRVDAYANCFVRRDHGTKQLDAADRRASPAAGPAVCATTARRTSSDVPQALRASRSIPSTTRSRPTISSRPPAVASSACASPTCSTCAASASSPATAAAARPPPVSHVLPRLHTGLYRVVYVSLSTGNVMDLYKTIAWEMGLPVERSRAALYRQIRSEVSRLCAERASGPCSSSTKPTTCDRCARGSAPAHQLRDGLREPPLAGAARPTRAASPHDHGRPRGARPTHRRPRSHGGARRATNCAGYLGAPAATRRHRACRSSSRPP